VQKTLRSGYKNQSINIWWRNNRCFFCDSLKTRECTPWAESKVFEC